MHEETQGTKRGTVSRKRCQQCGSAADQLGWFPDGFTSVCLCTAEVYLRDLIGVAATWAPPAEEGSACATERVFDDGDGGHRRAGDRGVDDRPESATDRPERDRSGGRCRCRPATTRGVPLLHHMTSDRFLMDSG